MTASVGTRIAARLVQAKLRRNCHTSQRGEGSVGTTGVVRLFDEYAGLVAFGLRAAADALYLAAYPRNINYRERPLRRVVI